MQRLGMMRAYYHSLLVQYYLEGIASYVQNICDAVRNIQ